VDTITTIRIDSLRSLTGGDRLALLRLLQLCSPALPVGAYAYSQGLEYAVDSGWIGSEADTCHWLLGLLKHTQTHLDVPVFARLYHAWSADDNATLCYWNAFLHASREARELQQEDHHLGTALARLLSDLAVTGAAMWLQADRVCFATLFTLAAVRWQIGLAEAVTGYLWTWTENQVAAATKLVPLGQTAAQRILSAAMPEIDIAVRTGLLLSDDDIGCSAAGLGISSALHETQYSRLFRS
jgi:urease accessory protein